MEASIGAHPQWSPDGSQLAFLCETIPGSTFAKICIVGSDGGGARVIDGEYAASLDRLSWSPDGERIVFSNYIDGDLELYTVALESGELQRLTDNQLVEFNPVWSFQADAIAFLIKGKNEIDVGAVGSQGGEVSILFSLPHGFSDLALMDDSDQEP